MKVYEVNEVDGGSYMTRNLKDALYNAECELETLTDGEEITIAVHEMTQEEFDALPEYTR